MRKSKQRYSLASKERWAKRTPEVRSEMMRSIVMARWEKSTPIDRQAHMQKMREAKKLKRERKEQEW